MPSTYTPIATTTLSSTSSSITFSSVPQTYTDLVVIVNSKFTVTDPRYISLQFNGDANTNYSMTYMGASPSGTLTGRSTDDTSARIGNGSAGFVNGVTTASIFNYANGTTYKSTTGRSSSISYAIYYQSLWSSIDPITSVTVTCDTTSSNAFASGSIFSLYGIKAA